MSSTMRINESALQYIQKADLYIFYQEYIASKFTPRQKAPHIQRLSQELMYFNDTPTAKPLVINMPPRHSKSSLVTLAYPLWTYFNNPDLDILIVNNTQELANKFGIQLRELIRQHGQEYNTYISDIKHSSSHIMTTKSDGTLHKGGIRLVGATGTITGTNADLLIVDDPYKGTDEELTPHALDKKIDWFKNIILQRVEPHTKLAILHTRWKTNDLSGYLRENHPDDYRFVVCKAILPDNRVLWSERYTLEMLLKRKEQMGERLFQALYQQEPLDSSTNFFDVDQLRFTEDITAKDIKTVRAWDIAYSESKQADYTVGCKLTRYNNNDIELSHMIRGKFADKNIPTVVKTAERDTPRVQIGIENQPAAAGKILQSTWKKELKGYRLRMLDAVKDKVTRAIPLQNVIGNGRFIININDNKQRHEIIRELESFPEGQHDDIVDSIAYAVTMLEKKAPVRIGGG